MQNARLHHVPSCVTGYTLIRLRTDMCCGWLSFAEAETAQDARIRLAVGSVSCARGTQVLPELSE